ncbi:MAG: hypothetical protein IT348_01925 [Candidatus Eisenbacteria bacterium]|nr:hypothetical protein [Candidatus Eisenbacteria bacterium]
MPSARYSAAGVAIEDQSLLGRLCLGSARATYAVPISDGAEGAGVVWIESAGENCDLRVQHVGPDGAPLAGWPEGGRVLCDAPGTQTQPCIASAAAGGLWLAWKDYREPQRSAVYLTHLDASGTAAAGYPESGLLVSDPAGPASDPALIADDAGGVWLIWQQGRTGGRTLRVKHFGGTGGLSPGWEEAGRVLTPVMEDAVHPTVAKDPTGGFTLAWVVRQAAGSQLRLARFGAAGALAPLWPAQGLAIAGGQHVLMPSALVTDTSGVLLSWSEFMEDSGAVRVTRLSWDGVTPTGWAEGGRVLGDGAQVSGTTLASDGAGGAYLAWSGTAADSASAGIHLVHVGATGAAEPGWSSDGVRIPGSGMGSYRPRLLEVEGGVLASWSESAGSSEGVILSAAMATLGEMPELAKVEAWPDLVRIAWRTDKDARYELAAERQGEDGAWLPVGALQRSGADVLALEDREVTAGESLRYRLRLSTPELEVVTGELEIRVPASAPLAIHHLDVQRGRLRLTGSVPGRGESRFELFDVQGRRLLRDVRRHEHAGDFKLEWPVPSGVRGGVFFLRLSLGNETKTRRFVVGR